MEIQPFCSSDILYPPIEVLGFLNFGTFVLSKKNLHTSAFDCMPGVIFLQNPFSIKKFNHSPWFQVLQIHLLWFFTPTNQILRFLHVFQRLDIIFSSKLIKMEDDQSLDLFRYVCTCAIFCSNARKDFNKFGPSIKGLSVDCNP